MLRDQPSRLRKIVIGLGIVETTVLLLFIAMMQGSTDPLAKAIGSGMTTAAAVPLIALVLPGLVLGLANRLLGWALAFLVVAIPVSGFLWAYA